jgi:urate oxidase
MTSDDGPPGGSGIVLGPAQYGKAEVRLLHVGRDGDRHEIADLNVSVTLAGDLADTYLTGDNTKVLTTDAQKNTVYAFARKFGATPIEEFGLRLAGHFAAFPPIDRARVRVEQYGWRRIDAGDAPHPHSFQRLGGVRLASIQVRGSGQREAVAGIEDLVLLKSAGSEFHGFLQDPYTTLEPTDDRILATEVRARWRLADAEADWEASFAAARHALAEAFATTHSRSLQQTLYAMGEAVLAARPEVCEVRLSLPNRHHFLVDMGPFGLDNPGVVFSVADRPYGLIEGTVLRAGAPPGDPGHDW